MDPGPASRSPAALPSANQAERACLGCLAGYEDVNDAERVSRRSLSSVDATTLYISRAGRLT